MDDPFQLLDSEFAVPPTFDEAVREHVEGVRAALERFTELHEAIDESLLTAEEWRVVEQAVEDLTEAVERAEEGYVAAMFDSHAWYRILESLDRVRSRLNSASGVMELARGRTRWPDEAARRE
jgi:uncharacterized protein Yka (UPF0111/DUF47 family)